jgi:hypothetical protein
MAKAKNIPRPVKRQRKAKVAAAHESAKEFAERQAAEWVQSNPGLVKRLKRFAEPPGEAELAARAEFTAARKEIGRYIAIRDNQIPPPWLEPAVNAAAPTTAMKKGDITLQIIKEVYCCRPHTLSTQVKTATVQARVNDELKLRNIPEHVSWDTINRALGRGLRQKK